MLIYFRINYPNVWFSYARPDLRFHEIVWVFQTLHDAILFFSLNHVETRWSPGSLENVWPGFHIIVPIVWALLGTTKSVPGLPFTEMNETEHAKAGKRVNVQQLRLWCPFPRVPFLEHSAPFCSSSLTESLKPAWTIKGNPRISNYDWVVMESDCILRRRKDCSLLVWRIFWGFRSLNKHGAITLDVPPLKTCHSTSYHAGIWRVKWQDYQGRTLWNVPELLT